MADPLLIIINSFNIVMKSLPSFFLSSIYIAIILVIGYVIGRILYKLLIFLLEKVLELDNFLKKKKLENVFYGISFSRSIATLAKWYVYSVFFIQSLYVLGHYRFIRDLAYYLWNLLPNIYIGICAIIILLFMGEILKNLIRKCKIKESEKISEIVKHIFLISGIIILLERIGINTEPIFEAIKYFAISLFIGIGFALGFFIIYENKEKLKI